MCNICMFEHFGRICLMNFGCGIRCKLKRKKWNSLYRNCVHYLIVPFSICFYVYTFYSGWICELGHIISFFFLGWSSDKKGNGKNMREFSFSSYLIRARSICIHSSLILFYFYDFMCVEFLVAKCENSSYTQPIFIKTRQRTHAFVHSFNCAHTLILVALFLLQASLPQIYTQHKQFRIHFISFHFWFLLYLLFRYVLIHDILCWLGRC